MWFWTLCSLNWLLMMMMIYVDEFLHEIREDFYGVCMYWKMLMLIVDDLLCERMYCRVICSCIHKLDIYIHIGDDRIFISILAMTGYLYPYWRWLEYFVFILAMKMIQMYLEVTTLVITGTTCVCWIFALVM